MLFGFMGEGLGFRAFAPLYVRIDPLHGSPLRKHQMLNPAMHPASPSQNLPVDFQTFLLEVAPL